MLCENCRFLNLVEMAFDDIVPVIAMLNFLYREEKKKLATVVEEY